MRQAQAFDRTDTSVCQLTDFRNFARKEDKARDKNRHRQGTRRKMTETAPTRKSKQPHAISRDSGRLLIFLPALDLNVLDLHLAEGFDESTCQTGIRNQRDIMIDGTATNLVAIG